MSNPLRTTTVDLAKRCDPACLWGRPLFDLSRGPSGSQNHEFGVALRQKLSDSRGSMKPDRLAERNDRMKKAKPYAALVTQAEAATSAIKDPELRRVAFERVLDDLLVGASVLQNVSAPQQKPAKKSPSESKRPKQNSGPKGYVRELVQDGFFKKPKTIAQVKAELSNRGHHIARTSLSGPLQQLCQERVLRRHKARADGKAKKATYNYSEW